MTCIVLKLSQVRWNSGVALVEGYHFTTASTWSEVIHLYGGSFAFHWQQNRLNIHTTHELLKWVPCRNGEEFVRAPAVNKIFFFCAMTSSLSWPFLFIYFFDVGPHFCLYHACKTRLAREQRCQKKNQNAKYLKMFCKCLTRRKTLKVARLP